jgi:CRISPR-associated protein Cas2
LKKTLEKIIDKEKDSLRYYNLGNKWSEKVEHIGAKPGYNPEGPLII